MGLDDMTLAERQHGVRCGLDPYTLRVVRRERNAYGFQENGVLPSDANQCQPGFNLSQRAG